MRVVIFIIDTPSFTATRLVFSIIVKSEGAFIFALQHIGFLPIGIREITRCWICHRGIYLAFVIFHSTFQLSAIFKHILRLLTSPCIGIEYCLQIRAIFEHPAHIHHCRGIEVGKIQRRQTRAIAKHPAHIPHRRGIEVRNIEFFQTRATIEHFAHIRHCRGVEVGKIQRCQTRATSEHLTHIRHCRGVEVGEIQRCQSRAALKHPTHISHLRGVEFRNVEFFQTRAPIEHLTHILHFRSIEVFKSFDCGECF